MDDSQKRAPFIGMHDSQSAALTRNIALGGGGEEAPLGLVTGGEEAPLGLVTGGEEAAGCVGTWAEKVKARVAGSILMLTGTGRACSSAGARD